MIKLKNKWYKCIFNNLYIPAVIKRYLIFGYEYNCNISDKKLIEVYNYIRALANLIIMVDGGCVVNLSLVDVCVLTEE